MKIHRIYAIIIRFLYLFRHSMDRIADAFYWPTIDLVIWGLTGAYLNTITTSATPIVIIFVSGIVFWYLVWRAQHELALNLLEDIWDKNLINIFVSPLKFSELIAALLGLGIIKTTISLLFTALIALFLYHVQVFAYGLYLIPFFAILIMTGWSVGFFACGLILRFGTRIQMLAWAIVALISPFSAIYYPLSALPIWAQNIAMFIPSSYVFEGMREVISQHTLDTQKLLIAFILCILYIIISSLFLRQSFNKILQKGLINID